MKLSKLVIAAAAVAACASSLSTSAFAQAKEQFFPLLSYRTGPYAPNGTPWANGKQDYIKMINARDGGINGVKITFEECETGYDRPWCGMLRAPEERPASPCSTRNPPASPCADRKAPADKIPLMTLGYGLSVSQTAWLQVELPLWAATGRAPTSCCSTSARAGGMDKLKGKKVASCTTTAVRQRAHPAAARARQDARLRAADAAVTPGVEQRPPGCKCARAAPTTCCCGAGGDELHRPEGSPGHGYPREKMYGVWWAGAEPDVRDVGEGAKGYHALALNGSGQQPKVIQDILKNVHDKGQGTGPKDEVGSVLYTRGVIIQMLSIEAVRRAQERFGKGKVMTGEQVRWGMENLALDQKKLDALGFNNVMRPISTSCADHMGSTWARVQTWDGKKWDVGADWYQADEQILKPMVKAGSEKYLADKKMKRRDAADCQS